MVKNNWVFHNAETNVVAGNEYRIMNTGSSTTLMVSITGTSTTYTLYFEGKGLLGSYVAITGYDMVNGTLASSTTQAAGILWQFDLTGLD